MRIAYVITRADDLGGSQIHVRDVAAALQRRGEQVAVFGGRQGILASQLSDLDVPFFEIPELARNLEPLRDARAFGKLRSALRAFAPDLISTHCAKAGVLGRLAARSLGTPVLFTAHGWCFSDGVPARRAALFRWLERSVAPLSHRIIVVCDADRQTALREWVASPRKLRLVYNGMPDVHADQRARPGIAPVRLITIARMCEQKDYPTLFRALAQLRDLDWHLDQIGDGPLQDNTRKLASELGLSERITFSGLSKDVAPLLARAQIYLLVSNWEGFPRSILEAMRTGLPVIASDVGGVREAVVDGTTGFLVARSDARTLADRLRQLIESPELRDTMGSKGRARYEQYFTFERMLDETCYVYREVIGSRPLQPLPVVPPARPTAS
jgi:glycosyltransferase involved in cell wall biosynthesis